MALSIVGGAAEKNARSWGWFLLHQILSTIGISIVAGFFVFAVSEPSRAHWILTETPYFPLQIVLAFMLGFTLRRRLRHESMLWVWVVPFLILCICFAVTPLPFVDRLQRYFGRACGPQLRCFVQLAVTLPFYTAVSYALAALLRTRLQSGTEHEAAKR